MITTRLTSRFGLSMPILLAPMDTFSDARLATAVTRAGGLSLNPPMNWRWLSVGMRKVPSELG